MNGQEGHIPLVTVIIPTIGRPKYIVECVESALRQDYRNLEILISDNAATVASHSLLSDSQLNRVTIMERDRRLNFSSHFNACLEAARGEYVMFLSDDDIIERDYVSAMMHEMHCGRDVAICFGRQIVVDADFSECDIVPASNWQTRYFDAPQFFSAWLRNKGPALGLTTFVCMFARRRDMLNAGGFKAYPDGSNADNFLTISLMLRGRMAVAGPRYFYRVYSTSFGLSTPFERLLSACRMYLADVKSLFSTSQSLSAPLKRRTLAHLRGSTARMMFARLRTLYRPKLGRTKFLLFAGRILAFAVKL